MLPSVTQPFGLSVHTALTGLPPVELDVLVQVFVALLKFSDNSVVGILLVVEEVRLTSAPAQMELGEAFGIIVMPEVLTHLPYRFFGNQRNRLPAHYMYLPLQLLR